MLTVLANDLLKRAIGEEKNSNDGVGLLLDLSSTPSLVELVLLNTTCGAPRV